MKAMSRLQDIYHLYKRDSRKTARRAIRMDRRYFLARGIAINGWSFFVVMNALRYFRAPQFFDTPNISEYLGTTFLISCAVGYFTGRGLWSRFQRLAKD